jgi:hypothetical protein
MYRRQQVNRLCATNSAGQAGIRSSEEFDAVFTQGENDVPSSGFAEAGQ